MRAILCVLDSFGVGSAPDANDFDRGANTFGHIAEACAPAPSTFPTSPAWASVWRGRRPPATPCR